MKKDTLLLIVFCITLPLLLLLLSYKIVLFSSNLSEGQEDWVDFFDTGDIPEGYTEDEVSHMQDVRSVMQFVNNTFFGLLLVVTLILTHYKKRKDEIRKLIRYGGVSTLAFSGVFLLFSWISFSFLFEYFHKIFFPQGNWQFSFDSLLIQTFPLDFFISISTKILGLTILLGILFILVQSRLKNDS